MISMPPTISVAAGIVSRITTRGSSAPKPASRHCQNAAALHRKPAQRERQPERAGRARA